MFSQKPPKPKPNKTEIAIHHLVLMISIKPCVYKVYSAIILVTNRLIFPINVVILIHRVPWFLCHKEILEKTI